MSWREALYSTSLYKCMGLLHTTTVLVFAVVAMRGGAFFLCLFFMLVCVCDLASARWATIEDVSIEIVSLDSNITVAADGSATSEVSMHQRILNEAGRAKAAHYLLYYTSDSTQLDVLEAKTIYKGKDYTVSGDMIEDRPLASSPHGFDQRRQVLISFPKVEVGAEIYIKYVRKEKTPPLDGFYSTRFYYGEGAYWQKANVKVHSALPLNYVVNDEGGALRVKGSKHDITVELIKPICAEIANGSESGVVNDKHLTWVSISSANDWKVLAKKLSGKYMQTMNQPLPQEFVDIVSKAKVASGEANQINVVTSLLNSRVQYMGDWRSVSGKFFPRDLAVVAESQVGDCKDFATSTAAMLRVMGYDANVCLVMRGAGEQSMYGGLPDIGNFNHAMVKVIGSSGKIYWVDPTNYVSMAQGIFEDVAGKMTLVLDANKPSYEEIDAIDPNHSVTTIDRKLVIKDSDSLINVGAMTLGGERAAGLAGARMYVSERSIRDIIFYMLSGVHLDEEYKHTMILPDLTSRVVSDLTFQFEYTQDDQVIMTNKGRAIYFPSSWVGNFLSSAHDQVSDLVIGPPRSIVIRTFIEGFKISDVGLLNYQGDSKWMSVSRKCTWRDNGTEVYDVVVIKSPFVPSEELKMPEYRDMKKKLEQNFQRSVLVVGN